ncbi:MAG: hypothetical protein WAL94_10135 [Bacteroidales bacterium]
MKHILKEGMIVESAPIIGIRKTVINSKLEKEIEVEYYSFNQKLLTELLEQDVPEAFELYFDLINTRALRLTNLSDSFEEDDFNAGMITQNKMPRSYFDKFFEGTFNSGLIKCRTTLCELGVLTIAPPSAGEPSLN